MKDLLFYPGFLSVLMLVVAVIVIAFIIFLVWDMKLRDKKLDLNLKEKALSIREKNVQKIEEDLKEREWKLKTRECLKDYHLCGCARDKVSDSLIVSTLEAHIKILEIHVDTLKLRIKVIKEDALLQDERYSRLDKEFEGSVEFFMNLMGEFAKDNLDFVGFLSAKLEAAKDGDREFLSDLVEYCSSDKKEELPEEVIKSIAN